jgi:hypothetical protein
VGKEVLFAAGRTTNVRAAKEPGDVRRGRGRHTAAMASSMSMDVLLSNSAIVPNSKKNYRRMVITAWEML